MRSPSVNVMVCLLVASACAATAPGQGGSFAQAEAVFTASLDAVQWGPVARSYPPIYSATLTVTVQDVLRGAVKPGARLTLHYRARTKQRPQLPVRQTVLITTTAGGKTAQSVEPATPELVKAARLATSLPLGWTQKDGKPVSPWAPLGAKAWPEGAKVGDAKVACSVTGRPALLAGPGLTLSVKPVPPTKSIKWTNPDGDGQFTLTLTNTTDAEKAVPALLSDGKGALWDECVVVICQGKALPLPSAKGVTAASKATVLGPGESVSTVVDVLVLPGLKWPRGGYRINFQFCLGELSAYQSLYYMSRHHEKLREQALKAQGD